MHYNLKSTYNLILITFIFVIIFFISCKFNNKVKDIKNASPYFTNLISGDDNKIFRNQNFNYTVNEVKKNETSKLYESTADHLFYEFSYPDDSTKFLEYANIQYFFNEKDELDIITVDIYLSDSIQISKLKNTLTEYFNKQYGSTEKDNNDYDVWESEFDDKKLNKKTPFSVAVTELIDEYGLKIEYLKE